MSRIVEYWFPLAVAAVLIVAVILVARRFATYRSQLIRRQLWTAYAIFSLIVVVAASIPWIGFGLLALSILLGIGFLLFAVDLAYGVIHRGRTN